MYCTSCGKKIDDHSNFCEFCGKPTNNKKEATDSKKEHKAQADIPNIGHFSWGGAFITFWYAIYMKFRFWWVLLIVLELLIERGLSSSANTAIAGLIQFLVVSIFIGFNARKWAWKTRKWDSLEQFLVTQRAWDMWGVVVFILIIVVGVLSNS